MLYIQTGQKEREQCNRKENVLKKKPLALIFVIYFWHYDVIFCPEDIFAFDGGGVGTGEVTERRSRFM